MAPAGVLAIITVFAVAASAQSPQQLPSIPAPTPVPASSLPSVPVPTEAAPPTYPPPSDPQRTAPSVTTPAPSTAPPPPSPAGPPVQAAPEQPPTLQTTEGKPKVFAAMPPYDPFERVLHDSLGSTYIPVDSPIYPMALRLYSMGYLDTSFINLRPWTRRSLLHMLAESQDDIMDDGNDEAISILAKLQDYLLDEGNSAQTRGTVYGVETAYTRLLGIAGPVLRDSYHLGQSVQNDYGRPYSSGLNNVTGFSSVNEWWRFSLYLRAEYQHAPSYEGYPLALATTLSNNDEIPFVPPNEPQSTIPYGNTQAQNPFRILEATLSFHLLGHEISGGKSDAWLGPAQGSAMAWSNNAENIYSFRINRVEPLHIPYFSRVFGPIRYDFFVGSLKGHTYPNDPWIHSETIALHPSVNFEFGFQRSVIWGGEGHEPVTIRTFLRSFFSVSDTTEAEKYSVRDPGARFSSFNFSYRLPFVRRHLTLYTDSETHDDVFPISAPRRAAYRPGLYLSQVPGLPKLDFRVEGVSTDGSTLTSLNGQNNYYETIQRQGYTNKGFILGDWIGREGKGGQAWLTWHLSGNEWIQASYLHKKTAKDFIAGGTTQNQFTVDVVKRLTPIVELHAWLTYERWSAPIWKAGQQADTQIAGQVTWYPRMRITGLNGK
jgi:hypothetical protein